MADKTKPRGEPGADASAREQELYQQRLQKAERWRELGADPWGNGFTPDDLAADVHAKHTDDDAVALEATAHRYKVAGRVVEHRGMGKAAFLRLRDRTGEIQVHVKRDVLGDEAYALFKQVERGDFLGVVGTAFRTKTDELTLAAEKVQPLTKALRPLPEKWHGLTDQEQRYRQRYLDLVSNAEVRAAFTRRSQLVAFIRRFLDERGYLEVETPMMHRLVSGAAAKPFSTHHNALDLDLYLRIAPELYLKRLLVGGFDRVYEINRNFRNEGLSTRHNPEFTMLEFYQAYATYEDLMTLTEEMLSEAAQAITGGTKVPYQGETLDFGKGWRRIPMAEAVREAIPTLEDKDLTDADRLRHEALSLSRVDAERKAIEAMSLGELVGFLFEGHVEHTLIHPTFVTRFPVEVSPLARRSDDDPRVTDRFELFVAGREIANAFSELNDPIDQAERFRAQLAAKARGQDETMDYDADYIRALEHGMPPAAGEGIGIDRLAMLFTDAASIRDVILFPLLKPQASG